MERKKSEPKRETKRERFIRVAREVGVDEKRDKLAETVKMIAGKKRTRTDDARSKA